MSSVELDTVGLTDLEGETRHLAGLWRPEAACAPAAALPYDGALLAEAVSRLLAADAQVRGRLSFETEMLAELFAHVVESTEDVDVFDGFAAP